MIEPHPAEAIRLSRNETRLTEHEASVDAAGCDAPTPTTVRSAVAGADCQSVSVIPSAARRQSGAPFAAWCLRAKPPCRRELGSSLLALPRKIQWALF